MRPIISIVGRANSGKTTLLESLIMALKKRGVSVAVIKHAGEDFNIDTEGKDTWRFRKAGSETVVISSPRQIAIMKNLSRDLNPQELARSLDGDFDLIITEGFKQAKTYKIEVHRGEQGSDLVSDPGRLLAIVTDERMEIDLPQFAPDEADKLADFIKETLLAKALHDELELTVNGDFVTLNPFVKKILANMLVGFVSSLKGIGKISNIRISLDRR